MQNDEYEKLAAAIWHRNELTIAALAEMDADDLQEVEKAIRNKYKVDIALNVGAEQVHTAVAKARSALPGKETGKSDRTLREANAEDS